MESSKAKIEKFFGSNEKLEAIANNKEFIEKVAGGQATPEIYQKELGKLGLELTLEEAKEVQTATERAMDIPPEKLNEAVLENVAGGMETIDAVTIGVSGTAAAVSGLASLGFGIASAVYKTKSKNASKRGDYDSAYVYDAYSADFEDLFLACGGASLAAGGLAAGGFALTKEIEKGNKKHASSQQSQQKK